MKLEDNKNEVKPNFEEIKKRCWIVFGGIIYNLALFILLVQFNFLWLFGTIPDVENVENPQSEQASEIYSSDNILLGKYFRENRSPVSIHQISPHVINALISTEDLRFEEHSGIDLKAFFAIFYYAAKGDQRGSSTITQQLAKNLFKTRKNSSVGLLSYIPGLKILISKSKEWITAIKLERTYTKEEILVLYLNTVDFGSGSYGIKTAARTYFNVAADSLTIPQAATLVGLLKATTTYSPIIHPEKSIERRNVVMRLMIENKKLSKIEYQKYFMLPIGLNFKIEDHNDGTATYFRGVLNKWLLQWCKEHNKDLYGDGLKIYTTIDSRYQKHAEDAVSKHMKVLQQRFYKHWEGKNPWVYESGREIPLFLEEAIRKTDTYKALVAKYGIGKDSIKIMLNQPKKMKVFTWDGEKDTIMSSMDSLRHYKYFLHAGFMAMDPYTGEIKAWVGGINYKYFKYDHVKQSRRQPGSSFKPFVYTAALDKGYSPCFALPDMPITFKYEENGTTKTWSPKNSDWVFTGDSMSLRKGMARSINTIAARTMQLVGINEVVRYAHKMGIESPLKAVPSICLGSSDVSVYEMTAAYSAFVNSGVWVEPIFVTRIEDRNGNILHEVVPKTRDAISEQTAYSMVHMLKGGTEERGGTSQALYPYDIFRGNEIGGKTGTTSNHSDGWFMGVTRSIVAGTWVGGEDRCIHFRNSAMGEGSKTALPIFGIFLESVYKDTSINILKGWFKRPKKYNVNLHCPYRPDHFRLDSITTIAPNVAEEPKDSI
ncbi:MAG: penicillin-binding protein [Cytophagales bacterium]|nr:MAG: penicillin-binding protein [Cytophagales bacterium]